MKEWMAKKSKEEG